MRISDWSSDVCSSDLPVSAFVTALLFVRPVIAAMAGAADPLPRTVTAPLGEALPANGPRTDYLRAALRVGRAFASTVRDSSMLATLTRDGCPLHNAPGAPASGRVPFRVGVCQYV